MSYYIIKGHSGRLAVVDYPPGMDVYVKGPGPMDSCFEVMEEMNKNQLVKGDAMRTLVTLAAVILMGAFAGMAMAEGDGNGGRDNSAASSSAVAAAFGVGVAGSISEGGSATAEGGDAIASGGNPSATGGQGVGNVSYETKIPRQAPGVAIGAGNNTATQLKCFSLFGSGAKDGGAGAAGGIWCWKQRDDYYLAEYERYSDMNLPGPASVAFCSTKLRWKPHGTKDQCEAAIYQSVVERHLDAPERVVYVPGDCLAADERLARCERAVLK